MQEKITQIMPQKKHKAANIIGGAFVVIGIKKLYINADAGKMLDASDSFEYAKLGINKQNNFLTITRCAAGDDGAFKLSRVCETKYARRIETNRALQSIIDAGFPKWMCDRQLPAHKMLDGSLFVDYRFEKQHEPPCAEYERSM